MIKRIFGSALLVLLVAGGIAVAATNGTAADPGGATTCVNDTNGLIRVSDTCRENETPMTLGGGSNTSSTYSPALVVPFGENTAAVTLPVTGVVLTGQCRVTTVPPEYGGGESVTLRPLVSAPTGETIDVFGSLGALGANSVLLSPVSGGLSTQYPPNPGAMPALVVSPRGAASITFGGFASFASRTCTFTWQAIETPS